MDLFRDNTEWLPQMTISYGGMHADVTGHTSVPGLFAAGTARSTEPGVYAGGFALMTTSVTGHLAGEGAAQYSGGTRACELPGKCGVRTFPGGNLCAAGPGFGACPQAGVDPHSDGHVPVRRFHPQKRKGLVPCAGGNTPHTGRGCSRHAGGRSSLPAQAARSSFHGHCQRAVSARFAGAEGKPRRALP